MNEYIAGLLVIVGLLAALFPRLADVLAWYSNNADNLVPEEKYNPPSKDSLWLTRGIGIIVIGIGIYFLVKIYL